MKYMLLIYANDELMESFTEELQAQSIEEVGAIHAELRASGEFSGAYGMADHVMARQVTIADGAPVVTDGPYLETKEYLASFDIIDCESLDRALEIAARHPFARVGQVEVWPITHEASVEG
jgi:hypothetical protein